ncbi:MAG: phosphohistidine phosphatase SixA [Bacteroidota bacterium]
MRLYFLRHADAETEGHANDIDRELTPEGIAEAERVSDAVHLLKLNITAILTSPMARAKATAEIVAKQFPSIRIQILEQLISTADPLNLFRELQSFPRDSRLLLVSHKPFVSRCVAHLININGEPKLSIKKASLACVEVGSPVQRGAGVLVWLLTNEQMQLMRK